VRRRVFRELADRDEGACRRMRGWAIWVRSSDRSARLGAGRVGTAAGRALAARSVSDGQNAEGRTAIFAMNGRGEDDNGDKVRG